ncbi:MAG: addiction module protein [Planctomycetia bacterium]
MNVNTIAAEVATWPVTERMRLIEEIWGGIACAEESAILDESLKRDLERRLEEYRTTPHAGSPWHEVEARLRQGAS